MLPVLLLALTFLVLQSQQSKGLACSWDHAWDEAINLCYIRAKLWLLHAGSLALVMIIVRSSVHSSAFCVQTEHT